MADENSKNIKEIQKSIATNDVVIFIGAGVSLFTSNEQNEASWKGLLIDGLQKLRQQNFVTVKAFDYFNELLNSKKTTSEEYLDVADKIFEGFKGPEDSFKNWLDDTIGQLKASKKELIEALGELDCPIMTTNYDGLLEKVLKKIPLTWKKFKEDGIGDSFSKIKNYILHVHGYYEEPESVVFNRKQYQDILNNEFAQNKLKGLLETKSLLFFGYGGGLSDPNFDNLLAWKHRVCGKNSLPIYLVNSKKKWDSPFLENIKTIIYEDKGDKKKREGLIDLIKSLKTSKFSDNIPFELKNKVYQKYLNFLVQEYDSVSVFGYSKNEMTLPLEKIFVDLKFDPTHPSIKAMNQIEVEEEFRRKILVYDFFTYTEKYKIHEAFSEMCKYRTQNINDLYKNFMHDQWLDALLESKIFTTEEQKCIKNKITDLKKEIFKKTNIEEVKKYEIQHAYNQFRNFIILGHPGKICSLFIQIFESDI